MMTDNKWADMPPLQAQAGIINEMARSMLDAITGDWDHAAYTIMRFGGQGSGSFEIVTSDGSIRLGMERAAFRLSIDLKRVMFVKGRGSWFSMRLTLRNGGPVEAKFDYETKPEFDSQILGVTPYWTSREQLEFPRDKAHQPPWYAELLDRYITAEQARLDLWAARDRLWAEVGQTSEVSGGSRLITLTSGVGLLATDGYSNPAPQHPGDPGFELYLPSTLFDGDADQARQTWPCKALNYLIGVTTEQDIDWPAQTADGPVAVIYIPNYANDTPEDWRGPQRDDEVCGLLVGVPHPGVPASLNGPQGPIRLIGVLPARPQEWAYLFSDDAAARPTVAARLAGLDARTLASPDRPSVA